MSSLEHTKSRKLLTFNTIAFLGSSVYFVGFFLYGFLSSGLTFGSTRGILTLVAAAGYGLISVRSFIGSWKAFSNLDYKKSATKGYLSWIYPTAVALLDLIF